MKKAAAKNENYKSKTWLSKRYQQDGKTVTAIATECGVSYQTVYNWLVRFDLIRNPRAWK